MEVESKKRSREEGEAEVAEEIAGRLREEGDHEMSALIGPPFYDEYTEEMLSDELVREGMKK